MRLLLDTHVLLSILNDALEQTLPRQAPAVRNPANRCVVSVASLWEIAIKARLGKLQTPVPPQRLEVFLLESGFDVLTVSAHHATADLIVEAPTRDPFDRLLIAQAQIEDMKLVTADRALADHPVTFR